MALVSLLIGSPPKGTRIERRVGNTLAVLTLDTTTQEDFQVPIEVTNHPVEDRSDISDHIIIRPSKLVIKGIISETPFSVSDQIAGVATTVASTIGQNLGGALGGLAGAIGVGQARTLAGVLRPKSALTTTTFDEDGNPTGTTSKEVPGGTTRLSDTITELMNIRKSAQMITIVTGLQQYRNYILAGITVGRTTNSGKSINVELTFQELQLASSTTTKVRIPKNKNGLPTNNQGKKNADAATGETEKKGSFLIQGLRGVGNLLR